MGRIAPLGRERWLQALPGAVNFTFGGGEANVAASIALLGGEAAFVTALPRNPIADVCMSYFAALGVDVSRIVRMDEGRLGLYYLEPGANQRSSVVTYDRSGSTIALAPPEAYNWHSILHHARWLHVTGITPAISRNAAEAALAAVQTADDMGLTVSCDLNYRAKLWNWDPSLPPRELASTTMRRLLKHTHVVIANEEDADMVLGIRAAGTDVEAGRLQPQAYADVAREIVDRFPNVTMVAFTLRESISADHNNWGGLLYDARSGTVAMAPLGPDGSYAPYEIRNIVDRVGAGDAFAAGLILALLSPEMSDPPRAVAFAAAASCLKHSIPGDLNLVTRSEVEALLKGKGTGRVRR